MATKFLGGIEVSGDFLSTTPPLTDNSTKIATTAFVQGQGFLKTLPIHSHAWTEISGKPTTFAPSAHTHGISDVTGLQTALDGKQAAGSYAAASHTHTIANITGLQTALDGKQAAGSYAAASHTHTIANITGLQTALDGKQAAGSYAAASHTHTFASITSKPTTLAGYGITDAATSAQGANADVAYSWGDHALAGYLDSRSLEAYATQEYVNDSVSALVSAAPATLDTLNELAAALGDDPNFATTISNQIAGKANASHTHTIANITGLQTALDGKAASSHTHTIANVTGLQAALDGKQPVGSYLTAVPDEYLTQAEGDALYQPRGSYLTSLGFSYGTGVSANYVVQRNANGYIYANHINFSSSETENPTINSFFVSNGDGWSRKATMAHVKSQLGLGSAAYTASTDYAAASHTHAWTSITGRPTKLSEFSNDLGNYGGWITASHLNDYTNGSYRVIADYDSSTTWYMRGNGQFIWGNAHDWTQSFRLSLNHNSTDNGTWAFFGQQDSNTTNGRYRGVRIRKYAGGAVDGDLSAGAYYIGDTRKDTNWDAAYSWGNHAGLYAAASHTHTIAQVSGLQSALDGKAAASHTHAYVATNGSSWSPHPSSSRDGSWNTFYTDYGYIQFGPANSSWAHIYSDKNFYFNQNIYVNNAKLATESYVTSRGYLTSVPAQSWSSITGKPAGWLDSTNLIQSYSPSDRVVPSGFYEDYRGNGNPTGTWFNYINVRHSNPDNGHGYQLGMSYYDNNLWFRSYNGGVNASFQEWAYAISSQNIGSQSVNYANSAGAVAWGNVTGKPSTFTPSSHTHAISEVSGLQSALDGKQAAGSYAASSHSHPISQVTGLQGALDAKQNASTAINTGNIGSQSVNYAASAGNSNNLGGLGVGSFLRDDGWNTYPGQDANTQGTMRSDFTYSNNAPFTGELIRFGASGYSLQLNSAYGYSGLAYRTNNGDRGTSWNEWFTIIDSGNIGSQSVAYAGSAGNADMVDGYHLNQSVSVNASPTFTEVYANGWFRATGNQGLYNPTNNAHFRANPHSYGAWSIIGERNGWKGIEFEDGWNGNVTLMVHPNSRISGFHNNSYGWQTRWDAGTLYIGKGTYGGSDAVALDSSNWSNYIPVSSGMVNGSEYQATINTSRFNIFNSNFTEEPVELQMNDDAVIVYDRMAGTLSFMAQGIVDSFMLITRDSVLFLNKQGGFAPITCEYVEQVSDINLKHQIQTIPSALEKVNQLRGVEFLWKSNDKPSIGFIAQEVEEVVPVAVGTNNGTKTIDYSKIVPILTQAIKEQQAQINALMQEIELLKTK